MKTVLFPLFALSLIGVAHAQSATYAVDPTHTSVIFESKHFGTSTVRGRFAAKEGSVTIDPAAKTGKVQVTFEIASITTGVPALDTHLKSKDFFDAANTPTATFVGDKVTFDGTKVSAVSGNLTLLGKTLPATLNGVSYNCYGHPMLKRQVCGGDFETTITRSQWGINYGLQYGFPDNIHLLIQVEAVKQ